MKNATTAKNKKSVAKRSKILLFFAVFFFATPMPLGFDILPDVFGCIFLIFGLTQLSYFDSSVESARKGVIYLAAVEFIHLLIMKSTVMTSISTNRLLAVTVLSIVQGILYILIIKNLFAGVSYFALRNNCHSSSELSDGAAFMTYLAFFIRVGATFVPELIALLEMRTTVELDFDIYESLVAFVKIKPVIVVLFTLISLGVFIAWGFSVAKLIKTFANEASDMLDSRYESEYLARPEKTTPKKLKRGYYAICLCLVFLLDIEFDGTRILPAFAAFLLLPFALMLFKDVCGFKKAKTYAIPTFVLFLVAQLFIGYFAPNGAIVIYETKLWVVAVGSVIALSAVVCAMLCVKALFVEAYKMRTTLGLGEDSYFGAWVIFCGSMIFYALGIAVPYLYSFTLAPRLILTGVFIYKAARYFEKINDDLVEKIDLYGE